MFVWQDALVQATVKPPLVQLLWGDEPGPSVAVCEETGLPPGVVFGADDPQDVAPFKGHCRVLARDSGVLVRIVVKQSPHKQLGRENPFLLFSKIGNKR